MKAAYDTKTKMKTLYVGDSVMALNIAVYKLSNSLVPAWQGPYQVHEIRSKDTYVLKDQGLNFPRLYHAD